MKTYSKNAKLNAMNQAIENQLLTMCDTEKESIANILHYKKEYQNEVDFNLAQYGNLLISFFEIREFFISCGYKAEAWSDAKVWDIYKRNVGYVVRQNWFRSISNE